MILIKSQDKDLKIRIIRREIKDFFANVKFEEKGHKYLVNGKVIPNSVSTCIKKYEKLKDWDRIAYFVALSKGVTKDSIVKEWKENKDSSLDLGTSTHLFGEKYIFDKRVPTKNNYQIAVKNFIDSLPYSVVPIATEISMHHFEYGYNGTLDLLLYDIVSGYFFICDYKTSKDLYYRYKDTLLLYPFNFLPENSFNKYQLQLSYYKLLIEQVPNIKIKSCKVIWVKPNTTYEIINTEDYSKQILMDLKDAN